MDRTVLYRSTDGERIEYARVHSGESGGVSDGTIVGVQEKRPLRLRHEITCDSRWHARHVSVEVVSLGREVLSLSADEDGTWRRVDGGTLEAPLYHCFDVAIGLTPLPIALTIRRIALDAREVAIVKVADIAIPALSVRAIEHRYTCLAVEVGYSVYRLENFDSGERTQIHVDTDGLLTSMERSYTRVWPGV